MLKLAQLVIFLSHMESCVEVTITLRDELYSIYNSFLQRRIIRSLPSLVSLLHSRRIQPNAPFKSLISKFKDCLNSKSYILRYFGTF